MTKTSSTPIGISEEKIREMVTKGAVCQSQTCPLRQHCLRSILKDFVPENHPVVTDINLRNPKMQQPDCQHYCPDHPVRMPLGLRQMYDDIPTRLARTIKNHLISLYSRKGYYQYHSALRPVTPDVEATIRQTLLAFGWTQEPAFDSYVEEYLW